MYCPSVEADKERQALELQYEQLRSQLLGVAHRLNTFTIPSRLPPELLSEVFLHLISPDSFKSNATSNLQRARAIPKSSLDLVHASHVCRSWRGIALSSPHLWRSIVLDGTPQVNEFLDRSKGCVLDIWLSAHLPTANFESVALEPLLGHMDRIRSLCIPYEIWHRALLPTTFAGRTRDASQLLTYVEDLPMEHNLKFSIAGHPAPSFLSTLNAPNLRCATVALTSRLCKDLPSYTYLRSLTIVAWSNDTPEPRIEDALALLLQLPALERLVWYRLLRRVDENISYPHKPEYVVSLSKLRHIELHGDILVCSTLLRCLSFPTSASTRVDANIPVDWGEPHYSEWRIPALDIVAMVAARNVDSPGSLDSLRLTFCDPHAWGGPVTYLHARSPGSESLEPGVNRPACGSSIDFSVPHDPRPDETFPWMHPAFATRRLFLSHMRFPDPEGMRVNRLLSATPSIEELTFTRGRPAHLLELLEAPGSTPFPNLRVLRVLGCFSTFEACHGRWPGPVDPPAPDDVPCEFCEFLPRLKEVLRSRRDAGLQSIQLDMQHFPQIMSAQDEQDIRELTASVSDMRASDPWVG